MLTNGQAALQRTRRHADGAMCAMRRAAFGLCHRKERGLRRMFRAARNCVLVLLAAAAAGAQMPVDVQKMLDRLDRLEAENKRLSGEIAELRQELAAAHPATDPQTADPQTVDPQAPQQEQQQTQQEQLQVEESRTAELEQKKVESSQKFPVQLTGMLLFNAFDNGKFAGSTITDPVTASSAAANRYAGASFRQTVLGLKFFGPQLPGGGEASGSVYMDFSGGTSQPNNNIFRLRIATLDLKWKNTTITVGQDKPIIAPRDPTSLAQVAVSPLTGAGNLWQWQPQARIEQRFTLSDRSEIRAQAGVFESAESATPVPTEYAATLQNWRPAYEGRVEYSYAPGAMRFEIAPGYHASETRVAGQSVASRVASLDWLIRPASRLEFTGAWFAGKDVAGLGALRQGFTILPSDAVIPVHSDGGWGQATITATPRWSFHLFGGEEHDRASDLAGNGISRNFMYGGNTMWKLAPNVLASVEITQVRTTYVVSGTRLNNHYDLALAYLF